MSRVEATEIVETPVEDVFGFTDWCYNNPQWAPSIDHSWILTLPREDGMGKITHYVGRVMGREMEWDGESARWEKNRVWSMRAKSGMPKKMRMRIEMRFERVEPRKTRVTNVLEYRVPYPVIGWLINVVYVRPRVKKMARDGVEGIRKAARERRIPPLAIQMEKRKSDHPGYIAASP